MNKNEILKKLNVFNEIEFDEEFKKYRFKGILLTNSPSRLIKEYHEEFDKESQSEKVLEKIYKFKEYIRKDYEIIGYQEEFYDKYYNLIENFSNPTQQDVLKQWQDKSDASNMKGNIVHTYIQSNWVQAYPEFTDEEREFIANNTEKFRKIFKQCDDFYNDYKNMYTHIASEQKVADADYKQYGKVDDLLLNNFTQKLAVFDYKTNESIDYKGFMNKKMFIPLHKYPDCNHTHYSMQLWNYPILIEKNTTLEVGENPIIWFNENNENYEIIEPLNMKADMINILEERNERNMKSVPVLLYGKSGTGKTASFRNYKADEIAYINILDKPLPFKSDIDVKAIDNYDTIIKGLQGTEKKLVVIDDAGYLLTNELFARSKETGYGKFTQIAEKFHNLINAIKKVDGGKVVVITMHEEIEDESVKIKSAGKMIESNGVIEGNFTIAIRSICENDEYSFMMKNTGNDITKTPMGMFEDNKVENDFKIVEQAVREYYGLDKQEEPKEESEE